MTGDIPKQKVNVMFVVPTLRRAGAETQVIDLVNGIDNEYFSKTLVVFGRNIDQINRVDNANVALGHFPQSTKYDFSMIGKIAELIDQHAIDVIHCTLQVSLLIAWLARRKATRNPRLVVAIHTTINVSLKAELYDRYLYRWLIAQCDRVVFVCNAQAEHWKEKFSFLGESARVVYNGVDTTHFSPDGFKTVGKEFRRQRGIPENAVVIACIAGFRREKGHLNLIDAFSKLGGDSYLLLAGEGPCREAIGQLAVRRNVQDRVKFLGNVSDVRPVLAAGDVSVLASTAVETFSIAMLESMAMEVPTIVTDIGGLREAVVAGETGDLVVANDSKMLAEVLNKYLSNVPLLREMGRQSRLRVIDLFHQDSMVKNTAILLTAVCERA